MPRKPRPAATLRDLIRGRVAALALSQSELARRCGGSVSQPSLSLYLAGRGDLTGEKLDAVLAAVGLRVVVAEGSPRA